MKKVRWINKENYEEFIASNPLFIDVARSFASEVQAHEMMPHLPPFHFEEDGNGLGMLKVWYGNTENARFMLILYPGSSCAYWRLFPALDDISGWSIPELLIHFSFLPKEFFTNIIQIAPFPPYRVDGTWFIQTIDRHGEVVKVYSSDDRNELEHIVGVLKELSGDQVFSIKENSEEKP